MTKTSDGGVILTLGEWRHLYLAMVHNEYHHRPHSIVIVPDTEESEHLKHLRQCAIASGIDLEELT